MRYHAKLTWTMRRSTGATYSFASYSPAELARKIAAPAAKNETWVQNFATRLCGLRQDQLVDEPYRAVLDERRDGHWALKIWIAD